MRRRAPTCDVDGVYNEVAPCNGFAAYGRSDGKYFIYRLENQEWGLGHKVGGEQIKHTSVDTDAMTPADSLWTNGVTLEEVKPTTEAQRGSLGDA